MLCLAVLTTTLSFVLWLIVGEYIFKDSRRSVFKDFKDSGKS